MNQASHAILAGRLSKPFQIHSIPAEWSVGILRRYLKIQRQKGKKSFLHFPCKDQNEIKTLRRNNLLLLNNQQKIIFILISFLLDLIQFKIS